MNPEDITAELRDIKPALDIAEASPFSPYAIAGIVLAFFVLLAALAWWLRFRQRTKAETDPVSEALKQLDATRDLIGNAASDTYAMAVSDVLRRYIELQFKTAAVRQTTDEFLVSLAGDAQSPIQAHRESLRSFLRQCDLVKFARGELDIEGREQLFACARNFVTSTPLLPAVENDDPIAAPQAFPRTPTQVSQ